MPRLIERVAPVDAPSLLRGVPATHPWAWWAWAGCAAGAASLTRNPLASILIVAALAVVVLRRRTTQPWALSLSFYATLALFIVAVRVGFHVLLGGSFPGTVLFRLPEVPLPAWAAGIRLGGSVTVEGLAFTLGDSLRLAAVLLCLGAAATLANPRTVLKSVPAALHDLSAAVVVALTLIPQLVQSANRVRRGRRLRGTSGRGVRGLVAILVPTVEDAVETTLGLATSMEARGYGSTRHGSSPGWTGAALLGAAFAVLVGVFALAGMPQSGARIVGFSIEAVVGVALLIGGLGGAIAALRVAGTTLAVTRYRPLPWTWIATATVGSGLLALAAMIWLVLGWPTQLNPPVSPATWPELPWLAAFFVAALVAPALMKEGPRP